MYCKTKWVHQIFLTIRELQSLTKEKLGRDWNRRLSTSFLLYMVSIGFLSVFAVGSLWMISEWKKFQTEADTLRAEYMNTQKERLKHEVNKAKDFVTFMQSKSIDAGAYGDDVESEIQKECIEWISRIKFGRDGYVFAARYDGMTLSGPATGQNMYEVEDVNGVKIVQELIAAAQSGGGFVHYILPDFQGKKHAPKISYAVGVDPWQWYIGAGIYVDEIEGTIAQLQADLSGRIRKNLIQLLLTLFAVFAFILIIVALISNKIKNNINLFIRFFNFAESDFVKIDSGAVHFAEFRQLASAANHMIDKRKSTEEALQKSEAERMAHQEMLHRFMENAPVSIYIKDRNRKYMMVNRQFEKDFGVSKQTIIGRQDEACFPSAICRKMAENDFKALQSDQAVNCEEFIERQDGIHIFLSTKFVLSNGVIGSPSVICGISLDITGRKQVEERLRLTRQAVDTAGEAIVVTDADGVILDVNPAFLDITGFTKDEVIGNNANITKSGRHDQMFYKQMWDALTTQGKWEGEIWDRKKSGEIFPKWLTISSIRSATGSITHYVGLSQDITQQKEAEKNLETLAFYDPLTQLPNRLLFMNHLKHDIELATRHEDKVALLFIDLDRFKNINDSLGHIYGDKLLESVAGRLKRILRRSDTVARLGGDEFTVILSELDRLDYIGNVAEKILDRLSAPFTIQNHSLYIDASIGIAVYPDDAANSDDLLRCADLAMYRAKDTGRGRFVFFTKEMNDEITKRHEIEADLRRAVLDEEFVIHYQPKINLEDGSVVGMEALVRWEHPEKGLIPPFEFIPIAEETGIINPLGEWVLKTACVQTKKWRDIGFSQLKVAVNLSIRQFQDPNLMNMVKSILDQSGLSPDGLELEITESHLMEDVDKVKKIIQEFSDIGLSVSVDDFGTGYSSLSYLKHLSLESLKIDRSFVRDLHENRDDQLIVSAIISLAKNLKLSVVAEGVEHEAQLDFLKKKGCDMVQGYYFSKPVPADRFYHFLCKETDCQ